MDSSTVAARIAVLVRKHAPAGAKPDIDKEVAEIAALAVAAASGLARAGAVPVSLDWFKLANRAEIKISGEVTEALALGLVAFRGRRCTLVFADPASAIAPEPRPVAATEGEQLDIERHPTLHEVETKPPAAGAQQAAAVEFPELPEKLRRKRKKADAQPVVQQPETKQTAAPTEVAEPWIASVEEPGTYDPDESPAVDQ